MQYITNFIFAFFSLDDTMFQLVHLFMFFGLNTLVIKNSELTSISSFGEICISLNAECVDLSWGFNMLTCNSLFFSCFTDQAIQYCCTSTRCIHCSFSSAFLLAFFVCLFAFHLSLFFALVLGPKFNLSRIIEVYY